ncbi:cysteine proteinase [Lentinula edodes]|uniref:Cysteine proteinase n=1 Tax=Lentinula edodes TaxID=5353 RepID=A0A1Q3ER33_LENED|nr:cysteine proteinase [Lentinula edodes]
MKTPTESWRANPLPGTPEEEERLENLPSRLQESTNGSGHYTAFVASRGGWLYCDDSSVKNVDAKQVVNQKAYVLFYKRVKA